MLFPSSVERPAGEQLRFYGEVSVNRPAFTDLSLNFSSRVRFITTTETATRPVGRQSLPLRQTPSPKRLFRASGGLVGDGRLESA